MYKKFVAPIIDEPFTIYCDDYSDKKVRKQCVDKIVFTGEWAYYYHNELGYDSYSPLMSIVKVTYTYYDWMKKRKITQIIYKRNK